MSQNLYSKRFNVLLEAEHEAVPTPDAACETLYADIARSETKKIGRIAQDLRALSESLKAYLLSSDSE